MFTDTQKWPGCPNCGAERKASEKSQSSSEAGPCNLFAIFTSRFARASGQSAAPPPPPKACSNGSLGRTGFLSRTTTERVSSQALLVLHRAGASDIAELIASISASVSRPSETARNHIEKQDKSEDIAQAGSTSALSYRRQKPDHEPPIPTPTHITAKSITPTRAAECDSQSAATDPQPAPRGSTNETIERGRARPLASTLGFSEEGNMGSTQNYGESHASKAPAITKVSRQRPPPKQQDSAAARRIGSSWKE